MITGVETPLGRRVARLAAEEEDADVVGLAGGPVAGLPARVAVYRVDLSGDDVKPHLQDADVLVHLATSVPATPTAATDDVAVTRRVLEAAGDGGVPHLVVLSSATVYGAWPDNPVPLTEDATLRPHPGFAFAGERAEIERLAAEWRDAHPGTTVAVLRPARAAGSDHRDWLVRALRPGPAVPDDVEEPPVQFVDLDDLAAACDLARLRGLDGAFNVAPEGSIPGDQVRSLIGVPLKVPLPRRVASRLARWRFRFGLAATPPGAAALRPAPVGGGLRPAAGRGLGRHRLQRGGVRGGPRGRRRGPRSAPAGARRSRWAWRVRDCWRSSPARSSPPAAGGAPDRSGRPKPA